MKSTLYISLLLMSLSWASAAQAFDAIYYLVRHAEKQDDGTRDPALTEQGQSRAHTLAAMLKDVKLDAIYSTNFKRTRSTAAPTATQAGLEVTLYNPHGDKLGDFINQLESHDGSFLIVGHSNTTPAIAGALSNQKLPELQEHQFDRMYVVTRSDDGKTKLTLSYSEPRTH